MKSSRMAIGIAAAMAVTSVGFEARAKTVLTREECVALATRTHTLRVAACMKMSGLAYADCMYREYVDYHVSMAICNATPPTVAPPYGPPVPPQNPFPMPGPKPQPKWPPRTL